MVRVLRPIFRYCRDQQYILPPSQRANFTAMARHRAEGFSLRRQGQSIHHTYQEIEGCRRAAGAFLRESQLAKEQARPNPISTAAQPAKRPRPARRFYQAVAQKKNRRLRIPARKLVHRRHLRPARQIRHRLLHPRHARQRIPPYCHRRHHLHPLPRHNRPVLRQLSKIPITELGKMAQRPGQKGARHLRLFQQRRPRPRHKKRKTTERVHIRLELKLKTNRSEQELDF